MFNVAEFFILVYAITIIFIFMFVYKDEELEFLSLKKMRPQHAEILKEGQKEDGMGTLDRDSKSGESGNG